MCGRFTLRSPASAVAEQFGLLDIPDLTPRYNIAPTQPVAAVRVAGRSRLPSGTLHAETTDVPESRSSGGDALSPASSPARQAGPAGMSRQLVFLRWGLIPAWAEDASIGGGLINARAESAAQKPAFRAAFRRRRCLVVADGFYEWKKKGKRRYPYFIHLRDDRPFGFAGLWEAWEGPDHSAVETCTLLTTDANDVVRPIHDRMPVIIAPQNYATWLDPAVEQPDQLMPLLLPYPSDAMTADAVSTLVNSPKHDTPQCIEPISSETASLFDTGAEQ